MRISLILIPLFCFYVCSGQNKNSIEQELKSIRSPYTPTPDSLNKFNPVNVSNLVKYQKNKSSEMDLYFMNDKQYTGWSYEVFPDSDHRYRYAEYKSGVLKWQITFFQNGKLSSDFHMNEKTGKNLGSERMWHSDGSPYIDTYFSENGVEDGLQWRWHKNNELARKAFYKNGEMVFEQLFDINGKLIKQTGFIPESN